ncbi:MAG: tetratricopeptide repeat protein [Myxococcales bacterium]|nr:tetratricopeptide repeat protein [Myxococcales bacterium]
MRLLAALLALSIASLPTAAAAQQRTPGVHHGPSLDDDARAVFAQGREAYEVGRYAEALERFERAHSISGHPELLFNIGLAADRLREDERALDAFIRYLEQTPDESSEHRDQVKARVAALRSARDRERFAASRGDDTVAPERVAREAQGADHSTVGAGELRDDDGGVLDSFWFWAGLSVVVLGGAAAAYAVTREDDDNGLPQPNTGVVVPTLRLAP